MYFIYCVYNHQNGKIYIGQTNDLERRLKEHNTPNSHYTGRFRGGWVLIYKESLATRFEALKREKQLKSAKGREYIKQYIPG